MNRYIITITRNEETIFVKDISADEVVDAMRPTADFREIPSPVAKETVTVSQYKGHKPVVTRGGEIVKPAKRKYTKKAATGRSGGRSALSEEMKDDAVEWYEAGDGTDEIAEKLGVSRPTIVKALRERKVKMKKGKRTVAVTDEDSVEAPEASEALEPPKPYVPKISPERLADCKRLLGKGETMADIATKTGLDESQVERIAVSMGL